MEYNRDQQTILKIGQQKTRTGQRSDSWPHLLMGDILPVNKRVASLLNEFSSCGLFNVNSYVSSSDKKLYLIHDIILCSFMDCTKSQCKRTLRTAS